MRSVRALLVPVSFIALLVPALLAPPGAASGGDESLGVTPAELLVEGAQRGESYRRGIEVQNEFDSPTRVHVEVTGDLAEWVRTDSPDGIEVPPRTHHVIALTVSVPEDAPNGLHEGDVRVVAASKDKPSGSGVALRYAVAVPLDVHVGGEQVLRVRWVGAEAQDVEVDTPPMVSVRVANAGNVRASPRVTVEIVPLAGGDPVARAEGAVTVIPGEDARLWLPFAEALPEGQYVARVRSEPDGAFVRALDFKVLPRGSLGKDGLLRYLEHEPWNDVGYPVKVSAVFENVGTAGIGRAQFRGEVYLGQRLVGVLESDERVVRVGEIANLTAFFTPQSPGVHRIVGTVTYDGFRTPGNEGIVNVRGEGGEEARSNPFWMYAAAAGVGGLIVYAFVVRRR